VKHSDRSPETLGALLARVRGEQGISQLRLAERLCAASGQPTVTRHEVSRWEREDRVPTGYWLGWLGAVLDVPLAELERAAGAARAIRRRPSAAIVPGQVPAHDHNVPGLWEQLWPGVYRRAS
jgi:transcriptional regulator with XRE-family HTH domain